LKSQREIHATARDLFDRCNVGTGVLAEWRLIEFGAMTLVIVVLDLVGHYLGDHFNGRR
jgi:hypothetical protein